MSTQTQVSPSSKAMVRTGYALSALAALFFLMDGGMKLAKPPVVVDATTKLGYSANAIIPLGIVLIVCTLLYLLPRTTVLGAILLTGYLGGAVATHVRASGTWFEILFPIVFGALVWGGLYLREARVREIVPLR